MRFSRIAFCILLGASASTPICWGQCPFPKDVEAAVLISYLQEQRPTNQDPCIDDAFRRLNGMLPKPSLTDEQVRVLIRFLDYRRLPSASEQRGFQIHFSPTADQYPAVGSLFLIGSRANNLLVSALRNPGSKRFRENASLAWSLIHREDPSGGVRALVHAASSEGDPEAANNLLGAAIMAAKNCPADVKEKCNSELPH